MKTVPTESHDMTKVTPFPMETNSDFELNEIQEVQPLNLNSNENEKGFSDIHSSGIVIEAEADLNHESESLQPTASLESSPSILEGLKPTKRGEGTLVKPTHSQARCQCIHSVHFPLIMQSYDFITDTALFIHILLFVDNTPLQIAWIIFFAVLTLKESFRVFIAIRLTVQPEHYVEDNANDGSPDWMQYLINSKWLFIVAWGYPLAWIQYKERWINWQIPLSPYSIASNLFLHYIPSLVLTILVLTHSAGYRDKLHILILSVCSLTGSLLSVLYLFWMLQNVRKRRKPRNE